MKRNLTESELRTYIRKQLQAGIDNNEITLDLNEAYMKEVVSSEMEMLKAKFDDMGLEVKNIEPPMPEVGEDTGHVEFEDVTNGIGYIIQWNSAHSALSYEEVMDSAQKIDNSLEEVDPVDDALDAMGDANQDMEDEYGDLEDRPFDLDSALSADDVSDDEISQADLNLAKQLRKGDVSGLNEVEQLCNDLLQEIDELEEKFALSADDVDAKNMYNPKYKDIKSKAIERAAKQYPAMVGTREPDRIRGFVQYNNPIDLKWGDVGYNDMYVGAIYNFMKENGDITQMHAYLQMEKESGRWAMRLAENNEVSLLPVNDRRKMNVLISAMKAHFMEALTEYFADAMRGKDGGEGMNDEKQAVIDKMRYEIIPNLNANSLFKLNKVGE